MSATLTLKGPTNPEYTFGTMASRKYGGLKNPSVQDVEVTWFALDKSEN